MSKIPALLRDPQTRLTTLILLGLTTAQVFMGPMDFANQTEKMTVNADKQVVLKLAIALAVAMTGLWGVWRLSEVRRTLLSLPALMITAILFLTIVGASSGLSFAAVPTSLINFSNMLFVMTAISVLGLQGFGLGVVAGVIGTAVGALAMFYFIPEYGTFAEPISGGQFVIRLGGFGHPNSLARAFGMATVMTLFLFRTASIPPRVFVGLLCIFGWAIVLAKSRTMMVAGTISIALLFSDRIFSRAGVVTFVVIVLVGIVGVFGLYALDMDRGLSDKLLGLVSKTKDVEELKTGTGRNQIWAAAIRHISARPLTGYGLNSGPILLLDYSQASHNAVLNAALSGGLIAGMMMLSLQLWNAWNALTHRHLAIRALSAYLFLSCLTEDTIFETFPGPSSMLWYTACLAPVMKLALFEQPDSSDDNEQKKGGDRSKSSLPKSRIQVPKGAPSR